MKNTTSAATFPALGNLTLLATIGLMLASSGAALAQNYSGLLPVTLDRWNYPFGDSTGTRTTAPTFSPIGTAGFDDRDGEFLIGFNTTGLVPAGLDAPAYTINSLVITASVSVSDAATAFIYDNSRDVFTTYFPATQAGGTTDADAGRPVELFACGYRPISPAPGAPLWSATTFLENSPFASRSPNPPPARGNRNVFPVAFNSSGVAVSAANNITGTAAEGGAFDAIGLAIGQSNLAIGTVATDGTLFTFTLDLTNPGAADYVRQGLAMGKLNFIISSLHISAQPGSGQTSEPYPAWNTKENIFGTPAVLAIDVTVATPGTCLADLVGGDGNPPADGSADGNDFQAFLNAFGGEQPLADLVGGDGNPPVDGSVDGNDFQAFLNAFGAGC